MGGMNHLRSTSLSEPGARRRIAFAASVAVASTALGLAAALLRRERNPRRSGPWVKSSTRSRPSRQWRNFTVAMPVVSNSSTIDLAVALACSVIDSAIGNRRCGWECSVVAVTGRRRGARMGSGQ